ncbi:MAG TPA: CHAT domain-containing protein [Nannocystaceae bacterium]|nr:CHAT domain-containing protein [Nannocystaceae bacterium]
MRLPLMLLSLLLVFGSGGCWRMITKEAKREHRWKKRMARGPDGADSALRSARSLINTPLTKKTGDLVRYRMMAMRAISLLMESRGYDKELDEEAHRYYEEIVEYGDHERANAELARLYEHTGRAGKIAALLGQQDGAAPVDYESAIRLWRSQLAKGDLAASELTWKLAESLAGSRFSAVQSGGSVDATAGLGGRYSIDGTDWRSRYEVLRQRMNVLASSTDSPTGRIEIAEIIGLWKQAELIGTRSADDIMGRSYGDVYPVYLDGARVFAIAGEHDAAKKLFAIGRKAARGETSEFRRADFACTDAFLASRARANDAVAKARECVELAGRSNRELDIRELIVLGEAMERGDELDAAEKIYRDAIARSERQRDSFPVDERTVYFRTSVRRGYWGLARTLARKSRKHRGAAGEQAFVGALAAIEQVRARQLGELLAESGKQLGVVDSLAKLRLALGHDAALLDYVVMDDEVLLLAVTDKEYAVHFIGLDAQTIGHVSSTIATGLATPSSPMAELDDTLTLLGRALLLPARAMIEGKRRLVVLPDGALNAVPFDLLDLDRERYAPLVERTDVEVTPSLALMLAPSRNITATTLLGVGDPVYGPIPEVALANTELQATARAASEGYFVALPETRRELESIARTLGGNAKLLFGTDARESTITHMPLGDFGIVHFATHGILGRDVPGIDEPALVLAAEPDGDGFLTASEAAELELSARLTVLSACKTGAGDSASGEGVLGMSRAFMLAGSESVVVSLWSVDSLATEALMIEFYRRLQAGESGGAALRNAKLAVRDGTLPAAPIEAPTAPTTTKPSRKSKAKAPIAPPPPPYSQPRRDHPYYWGAFIIVGS